MIAILILQLLIIYDIDINKYLSPRTLNWCENMMKKINFKHSNNQKKIILYNKGYIYHRIYLALRVVIRNHLRQENPNPPSELIKRARETRNQTPDSDIRRIFKKDLGEGVVFEDDNDDEVKLKNLG